MCAHSPQHTDLLAALDYTQGQGIDNAQHRNNDGKGEQTIKDGEHLVNKACSLARILLTGIDLNHNQILDRILQVMAQFFLVIAFLTQDAHHLDGKGLLRCNLFSYLL